MNDYELSIEREESISSLAGLSVEGLREVLYYDWPFWEEHVEWLHTADDKEIMDWALAVGWHK
jgi:hypothetical protein